MPRDVTITGQVVDTQLDKGIGELLVEAWGKVKKTGPRRSGPRTKIQKICDTCVDVTSVTGGFNIKISGSQLVKLVDSKIWFKVYGHVGQVLIDTENSINWSPDRPAQITISVEYDHGGGGTHASEVILRSEDGTIRVHLDAEEGSASFGGNSVDGTIALFPSNVTDITDQEAATVRVSGKTGSLFLGGDDASGSLSLGSIKDVAQINLNAEDGRGSFGGKGVHGQVMVFPATATDNTDPDQATIRLDGSSGDIFLENADCAEDFDLCKSEVTSIQSGHVMVLGDEAHLSLCRQPYDNRVAGILSGAGDYRPGIVLDKQSNSENRMPLALVGKVFCWVDADFSSVKIGDLLTTSSTPGHAMKANNRDKAFGAVIGKALRSLSSGKELIPILVALQ